MASLSYQCEPNTMQSRTSRIVIGKLGLALLMWVTIMPPSAAQDEDPDTPKEKVSAPKDIIVTTADNVSLACTYYPGTNGKSTVPIVLAHGFDGVRGEFDGLARFIQKSYGHAVIVPDFRGHGESLRQKTGDGTEREIDPKRMRRKDFAAMFHSDMEAVKKYLLSKNNKGELNIDLLCIVGSEMGAIVAMNWAVLDWSWPRLPNVKQGQDVKCLVLISPQRAFKGLNIQPALKHRDVRTLSTLIMVGEDERKSYAVAKRLNKQLERFRPPQRDAKEASRKKSLFFVRFGTSLQGTKLLGAQVRSQNHTPYDWIGAFIHRRVVLKESEYPWHDRSSLLGG